MLIKHVTSPKKKRKKRFTEFGNVGTAKQER